MWLFFLGSTDINKSVRRFTGLAPGWTQPGKCSLHHPPPPPPSCWLTAPSLTLCPRGPRPVSPACATPPAASCHGPRGCASAHPTAGLWVQGPQLLASRRQFRCPGPGCLASLWCSDHRALHWEAPALHMLPCPSPATELGCPGLSSLLAAQFSQGLLCPGPSRARTCVSQACPA